MRTSKDIQNNIDTLKVDLAQALDLERKERNILFELGCLCDKLQDNPLYEYCSLQAFVSCERMAKEINKNTEYGPDFYFNIENYFNQELALGKVVELVPVEPS